MYTPASPCVLPLWIAPPPPPPHLVSQGEPGLWIYECLAACATDEERAKKLEARSEYEAAVRQYFQDDAEAARAAFERVLAAHPEDAAAKAFLDRLRCDSGVKTFRDRSLQDAPLPQDLDPAPDAAPPTHSTDTVLCKRGAKADAAPEPPHALVLQDMDPPPDAAPPMHGTDTVFRKCGAKADAAPGPPHMPSLSLASLPSPRSPKSVRSARYKHTSFRLPSDKVRPRADTTRSNDVLEVVSHDPSLSPRLSHAPSLSLRLSHAPSLSPRLSVVHPGQDEPEVGQGVPFHAKKRTALWKVKAKLWLKLGLAMVPPFGGLVVMTCLVFSDLIKVRRCVCSGALFSELCER